MTSGTNDGMGDPVSALDALGDEYSIRILSAVSDDEMSAKQISDELGIPIATVYRRIDELEDNGLIEYEGKVLTDDDKRVKVYRSYIDELSVSFDSDDDEPRVEVTKQSEAQRSIDKAWRRLS